MTESAASSESIRQSIAQFVVTVVRDVGFPVAVAAWLLYQIPVLQQSVADLSRIAGSVVLTLQAQQESLRQMQEGQRTLTEELRQHRMRAESARP